jgi:hypothetical protein
MASRRAFVFPEPGDTVAILAERVLPEFSSDDAVKQLLAWNLHLVMRRSGFGASTDLLCTDIVYLAPPPADG